MLTDLQKDKFRHFFGLLDSHKNGYLHLDDFAEITESIRIGLGLPVGDKRHTQLAEKSAKFFHRLLAEIEHRDSQVIYEDEWLTYLDKEIVSGENQDMCDEFTEFIIGFLFDLFDDNHDGYISMDEYVDMFVVYGIDIKYSAKSFINLDLNKDERLSRTELIFAFEEFLLSTDHKHAGNWIFGNWAKT